MKSKIECSALLLAICAAMLVAALTGCSTVNASLVPGKTIADLRLKTDVYKAIKVCEMACYKGKDKDIGRGLSWANNPATVDIHFADTAVLEPPNALGSPWKESWTVQRSGAVAVYVVSFRPSPRGGTDIGVSFPPTIK